MRYKVTTVCDAYTTYEVEAESPEEARAKFEDGVYISEEITDYANEEILEVSNATN